eukprot:1719205-Pleurochrysis_carterae.AAC.1
MRCLYIEQSRSPLLFVRTPVPRRHVVLALKGFFRSVTLGAYSEHSLQACASARMFIYFSWLQYRDQASFCLASGRGRHVGLCILPFV